MAQSSVYIMTNKPFGVIYIGVTNDLIRRVWEHKNNVVKGFSHRYQTHTLIYFEQTLDIETAIKREKQLKNWKRAWKISLIESFNPDWVDLYPALVG